MTSADELFRLYAEAYEAGEDPAAGDYVEKADGPDRLALELMIDNYLLKEAPIPQVTEEDVSRERSSARGQQIAQAISEPSIADLRRLRESQELELEELADRVLAAGQVEEPSPQERDKTADYLGRLERGELGRLSKSAWAAVMGVLNGSLPQPSASASYGMAFRLGPGELEADEMASQAAEAEVILNAYAMPSPRKWDRVDEFFLGEVDA